MESLNAGFEMVCAGGVAEFGGATDGSEASAAEFDATVQTCGRIFFGGEFDDAAELAAVFGGVSGGEHAERFDVAGIERRSKGGRAILRERHSVEYVLHLIFGAARMENAVGFIKPAGLIVDGVRKRATGLSGAVFAEFFSTEGIDGARFGRIDQRSGVGDFNAGVDGGDAESDRDAHGNFAADFDKVGPLGEAFGGDGEAVHAEGKFGGDIFTFGGDGEFAFELVGFADELRGASGGAALRVFDFDAKFTALALGKGHVRANQ